MLREGTRKHVGKTGSRGPVRLRANGLAAGRNAHAAPWAYDTYAPPCGTAKSVVGTGRTDRHPSAADGKFAPGVLLPDVKKPGEFKEPWKHHPVKAVIPAANAALPLSKSKCRLVQP